VVLIPADTADTAPLAEPSASDIDAMMAGTDGREWNYPPWVITPEDQYRWRICTLYAEKAASEDPESYADTVYFMSRALYHGDMPTE